MDDSFVELYDGYLLKCDPLPTSDNRFVAQALVSFAANASTEIKLTPHYPSFETARGAAECALREAKEWVAKRK